MLALLGRRALVLALGVASLSGGVLADRALTTEVTAEAGLPPETAALETEVAQASEAPSYVPGPWQPVARLDTRTPAKIMIKNQSGVSLEYSLTTGEIEIRTVANGQEAELTNLPREVFLLIDPVPSALGTSLNYGVAVTDENVAEITVSQSEDPSGKHTINIQPDGAIYIY
ncbi:MAG: hypothetical protein ACFBSC_14745 [Microcoleaceae cyanobacterium]